MKKCPICEKTFEDNLKFCQADGTLLVSAEEPEDPYKTTVANVADLPIPPLDPMKTMVAEPLPQEPSVPEVIEEPSAPEPEEEVDLLKTMVATEFPPFETEPESKPVDVEPATPEIVQEAQVDVPEPPKFSEPDINPPSFTENDPITAADNIETPKAPEAAPVADALTGNPFENADPRDSLPNDLSSDSPYGDTNNIPIPSPFEAMSPNYPTPSAPLPGIKEPQGSNLDAMNLPVASEGQGLEAPGWNPPATPNTGWNNPQGGQNTPFQPSGAGGTGQNKTLVFVSLGLGVLGLLILIPSLLITICGIGSFLCGIGAIITGFLGRSRAISQPEEYGGAGLGIGGIVLGVLSVIGPIAIVILYLVIFAGAGLMNTR